MTKKNKKQKNPTSVSDKTTPRKKLDPDRLVELEQERDALLVSITDLEREHEAGDLDQVDFQTLHDGYTARTASVLRSIEGHQETLEQSKKEVSA